MHSLLKRQLKKTGAIVDKKFLNLVNQAYIDADEDRTLLERSLDVSSKEMRELYETLDKTSQSLLKESQDRYNKLVYELRDHYFFYSYTKKYLLSYLSDSVYNILGYPLEEILNSDFRNYMTNDKINELVMPSILKLLIGEQQEPIIISLYHKNGTIKYLELSSYPFFDEYGKVLEIQGIARDITEEYVAQQKLHFISNHDTLTGISNRHSLYNKLEFIIADSERNHKTFALLYIDLDEFKNVNDTLGHEAGDLLLKEVTKRINKEIRQNDIFARVGGDEFVVVLTNVETDFVSKIAQTILEILRLDFKINRTSINISVSIGVATYPKDGKDVDMLLKKADSAMYRIKKSGKNNFAHS